MGTLIIKGKVFSGKGEGEKFMKLPWVKKQIAEKLGFTSYTGTLNIKLSEEDVKTRMQLEKAHPIRIMSAAGFFSGKCFKASLNDIVECAVIIPEVPGYPADVVEIVASTNLREKLQLKDGDTVWLTITI